MAQRFSAPMRAQTGAQPQAQGPRGYEDYLKNLDDLLKRNTGSGLFVGQDTSSNIPFYMPGKVVNQTDLAVGTPSIPSFTAPESTLPDQAIQPMSAEDFLSQFEQVVGQTGEDQAPSPIDYDQGVASTADGGVVYQDGSIHYEDGSVRTGDVNAYPIASMADGSVKYSDGSVKTLISGQGLSGLETGIFGDVLPTTQPYDNYNQGMGYANNTHRGTDIRTRNLTGEQRNFKLPVNAEVVQIITEDSGSPYGNSILFRLPSGEMLRFSHMSQIANVQPGQSIQAGQAFGAPGSTGNSTGEHLDLEYYNAQGNIDNPANFTGFTNPEGMKAPAPNQPAPVNQPAPQPVTPQPQLPASTGQLATQPSMTLPNTVKPNPTGNPAITTANVIDTANPTGNFDLGITETLRSDPALAKEKQLETVENLGIGPEIGSSERARAQGTNVFRQFAGDLVDETARRTGIRTDFGLSELLAGGRTKNTDQGLVANANASEIDPTSKPGEGVASMANSSVSDLQNVFKTQQPQETRAIGDVKGTVDESGNPTYSSLMDTAQSKAGLPKNDIRDPFFKMGGAEMFKQFLRPGVDANYNEALTMDLFNDDFYKDLGNLSSVFGGSKDIGAATQKFVEFEKQKYPLMSHMDYSDEYDSGSVDEYNKSADEYNNKLNDYFNSISGSTAGVKSIFTPRLPGSAKNVFAGTTPNASSYSVGTAPKLNTPTAPNKSLASLVSAAPSVSIPNPFSSNTAASSAQLKTQPKLDLRSTVQAVSKSTPQQVAQASAPLQKYNMSSPTSASSAQLKPQSQPSSNIFSKVASYVNNIFRRK